MNVSKRVDTKVSLIVQMATAMQIFWILCVAFDCTHEKQQKWGKKRDESEEGLMPVHIWLVAVKSGRDCGGYRFQKVTTIVGCHYSIWKVCTGCGFSCRLMIWYYVWSPLSTRQDLSDSIPNSSSHPIIIPFCTQCCAQRCGVIETLKGLPQSVARLSTVFSLGGKNVYAHYHWLGCDVR